MKLVVTKACLFLLSIIVLTSCNDNDPSPSIVGNWTVSSQVYTLTYNGYPFKDYLISKSGLSEEQAQAAVDVVTDDLINNNNFVGAIFNFKSDKTYSAQITYYDIKHTKFGKWETSDGKTLTLTNDLDSSDKVTATITHATNTQLHIDLPGGINSNTLYAVNYTVSVTAERTGEGDTFPAPVMSRLDSLVGPWVIASASPENAGGFDITGRAFIFKEDGTWLDRVDGHTFNGTWRLNPDDKTLILTEKVDGRYALMRARITSLSYSTLKLTFIGLGYPLSIALARAP